MIKIVCAVTLRGTIIKFAFYFWTIVGNHPVVQTLKSLILVVEFPFIITKVFYHLKKIHLISAHSIPLQLITHTGLHS